MLQVVKRIRAVFDPRGDLREEIDNLRGATLAAREQAERSNRMVEYVRKQVEEDERRIRDGL